MYIFEYVIHGFNAKLKTINSILLLLPNRIKNRNIYIVHRIYYFQIVKSKVNHNAGQQHTAKIQPDVQ